MKRQLPILLAAISAAAAPALAQTAPGDPGKMFMINAVTPGVVSFSGEGTAQFNNSASTANSFSVGSATQFGVNASASATADYMVDANSLLQLGAGAQLQQTIGTSSSAANTMAASEAAATAANTIANQKTTEEFGQDWKDYTARNGATTSSTGAILTGEDNLEYKTEANYEANKKSTMDRNTQEAYANTTQTATASSQNGASGNGIISGEFITSNKSTTQIGANAGITAENTSKATAAADEAFGTNYGEYTTKFNAIAGVDATIGTEAEKLKADALGIKYDESSGKVLSDSNWNTSKSAFSDSTFSSLARSAASAGTASNESNATVTVTGVGSIATLNASPESAFNVDVATRIRNQIMENNATASGSAGGSLNTVSMANQSNSTSASAFMQAFGADTVQLNGDSTGKLLSATVNGRFNVTLDADATVGGTGLQAPVVALPTAAN